MQWSKEALVIDTPVLERVLAEALRNGGDFAEVFAEDRSNSSAMLDDGRVEELSSGRERGAGIRVVTGETTGFAHTADLSELTDDLGARAHRIFPGRLDRRRLGFGERAVVGVVRARDGDFRPWPEIVAWADGIAASLAERAGGDLKDHGGVR